MLPGLAGHGFMGSADGGSDSSWGEVVLLAGMEGTDGSTTFTDESSHAHTMTAVGNAQIDTSSFAIGTSAALFDGTGDWIELADSDDWAFGTGAFTIELWVRFTGSTSNQHIIGQWSGSTLSGTAAWRLSLNGGSLTFGMPSGTAYTFGGAWSPTLGDWYYIAVDRTKGVNDTLRMYAGQAGGSTTLIGSDTINTAQACDNEALALHIGKVNGIGTFTGSIDEVRITKGTARYSGAGYAVPTAFPRS